MATCLPGPQEALCLLQENVLIILFKEGTNVPEETNRGRHISRKHARTPTFVHCTVVCRFLISIPAWGVSNAFCVKLATLLSLPPSLRHAQPVVKW